VEHPEPRDRQSQGHPPAGPSWRSIAQSRGLPVRHHDSAVAASGNRDVASAIPHPESAQASHSDSTFAVTATNPIGEAAPTTPATVGFVPGPVPVELTEEVSR
jgi:hypothetical protein